jgi:hypothetical protein
MSGIIKLSTNYPQITESMITESMIYELGIETTKKLNESQDELKSIKYNDGEANPDTELSKLACYKCEVAFREMKIKNQMYSETEIICEIPDINMTFKFPNGTTSQRKIELKS